MTEKIAYPIIPASCVKFPDNSDLASAIGVAGGLATLDSNGKIPSANLPSRAVVNITDTAVTINMQANTVYICSNPVSSLTITGIPNSIDSSVVIFTPDYGSAAQQDLLCPITMPQGVSLLHFDQNEYKYNKQAIICVQFGIPVFGQQ